MTSASRHQEHDDGLGGIVRRVFQHGPTAEERLEQLLAERRRELDETAARFDASVADLERREQLLRDSRASVERMLRLGRSDLEARETELTGFLRELTEREARIARAEEDISHRRQELGAVELKRAALERRARDLEAREAELAGWEKKLADREGALATHADTRAGAEHRTDGVQLAFVPGPAYRVVDVSLSQVVVGSPVEVDGTAFVVGRIGRSPLPGDERRCAYLVRSPQARPAS